MASLSVKVMILVALVSLAVIHGAGAESLRPGLVLGPRVQGPPPVQLLILEDHAPIAIGQLPLDDHRPIAIGQLPLEEHSPIPSGLLHTIEEAFIESRPQHEPLDLEPVDVSTRLQEYPKLRNSLDNSPVRASMHTFFEPQIEVEPEELDDLEWEQYLQEGWGDGGVVPALLPVPPPYVANVDFGNHNCAHLGNRISPRQSKFTPKSFQFPGNPQKIYTILLLDLDHQSGAYINWMKINVPDDQFHKGIENVAYEGPRPLRGSGLHRQVFLVYQQQHPIALKNTYLPKARPCQSGGRNSVELPRLTRDLGLKGPIAGNFFLTQWDVSVEHTCVPVHIRPQG